MAKKKKKSSVRFFDTGRVALAMILEMEKYRVPVGAVDEVLAKIREDVMNFTPACGHGLIGLPQDEYEKRVKVLMKRAKKR